jgi:DNA-directed RNA polymerase specialized sigma24 family protein
METNHTPRLVLLNGHRRMPAGLTLGRPGRHIALSVMGTGDPRRHAILSDARVLDSIRTVIRGRGVGESDIDDVLHDVIEAACADASLPLEDKEQTRAYLCGCARYKSIDDARARKKQRESHGEVELDALASADLPADQRALAHELDAQGQKAFPFTYPWFRRFAIGGETHEEIATDPQVSVGHVANEISTIRRALRAFALAGFALLVGALALRYWKPGAPAGGGPIAHSAAPAPKAPPAPSGVPSAPVSPPEAVALRDRAAHECAEGHWSDCLDELRQALVLDPSGESPAVTALRERAEAATTLEAKPRR